MLDAIVVGGLTIGGAGCASRQHGAGGRARASPASPEFRNDTPQAVGIYVRRADEGRPDRALPRRVAYGIAVRACGWWAACTRAARPAPPRSSA